MSEVQPCSASRGKPTGVLLLTLTFEPDVGGVETHLSDLVREVKRRPDLRMFVCSYKPIVTNISQYRSRASQGNVDIRRWWWFGGSCGGNLFRKFEPYPALLFLYITPYFLLRALLFMLIHGQKVDVIHVHGLNMAFIGVLLARLFGKRVIMQTHALYNLQPGSLFGRVARWTLRRMDRVLTLSTPSKVELVALGIPAAIVGDYRYWIDLQSFSERDKLKSKEKLSWPTTFTVLFVGRLIDIKGAQIVCELAERFPQLRFVIVGDGPDKPRVEEAAARLPNLHHVGLVKNTDLPVYYQAADLTIVPSQYPEGFGRVISESLACGTPVIASNIGGIPDAMDGTVGILSGLDVSCFAGALSRMCADKPFYDSCRRHARSYAEQHAGAANADIIFNVYSPRS